MQQISKDTFFEITKSFEIVPFTQSRGMYEFHVLSGIERIHFFVNDIQNPLMACFGHEKKFLSKKMLLIESECYASASNSSNIKLIRAFYSEIIQLNYDFVETCSIIPYHFNYEIALRQAGYLRPVGQFSFPVTKVIDITKEFQFRRNWQRNLKNADENNLKFEIIEKVTTKDCEDFVSIYNEMVSRKSLFRKVSTKQIAALCSTDDSFICFVSHNGKRVAANTIYTHASSADPCFAATGIEAMQLSASFYMFRELFLYLREKGVKTFDIQKLIPSTGAINDVFLFKNGMGGEPVVLNGEWSWYKKKWYRPLMYFVKKYLFKRPEL